MAEGVARAPNGFGRRGADGPIIVECRKRSVTPPRYVMIRPKTRGIDVASLHWTCARCHGDKHRPLQRRIRQNMTMATVLQDLLGLKTAAVAVTFRASAPDDLPHVASAGPSGCSYWKRAAEGETF